MIINLDEVVIDASTFPARTWAFNRRVWEEYTVRGFLKDVPMGHLRISRRLNCVGRYDDKLFLDITKSPPVPKPYVSYQETEKQFRGQGICGKLIVLANEFYRGKLGTCLYSDTYFVASFKKQSKGVWKKLEARGLAVFEPHVVKNGKLLDRWVVL